MDLNCVVMQAINNKVEFENLVFECTNQSIKKARELIHQFSVKWVQRLIMYAGKKRILSFKLLGDLFEETGKILLPYFEKSRFSDYLCSRNLITEDDYSKMVEDVSIDVKPCEEYEFPIKENTFAYFILNDDIRGFVNQATLERNSDMSLISFHINGRKMSPIEFACYCGSINIVKYLIINNVKKPSDFYVHAICGGNEAMIDYLISSGYDMHCCLLSSIQYHRNNISKWLCDYYENTSYSLASCIIFYNTEMLLYKIQIILHDNYLTQNIFGNVNIFAYTRCTEDILLDEYFHHLKTILKE